MKYFSIFVPDPVSGQHGPPSGQAKQDMDAFVAAAIARGEFLGGGGFLSLQEHGAVVRRKDGATLVVDGPYAESKEIVGGFAMLQYDSREAAIEGAKRFMAVAGDGECISYRIAESPEAC